MKHIQKTVSSWDVEVSCSCGKWLFTSPGPITPEVNARVQDEFNRHTRNAKRNENRRERDSIVRDMGLKKVRGNLGGTYWE